MKLNKNEYREFKSFPEKVVQFGEGNFLRAFVDWMIDKMNKEAEFNGSVVVVQPIDKGLIDKINEQDGLYTLYLNESRDGKAINEHSIINCINRGVNPYEDYKTYLEIAENPELRFVISNTTESGIAFFEGDKLNDAPQNSFPGKLTAFLYHRYKHFQGSPEKGLIILPCELIDRNGEKLKKLVLKYAELWNLEEAFMTWLNEANTFCCTLVDRVVTGYPRDKIDEINKELQYEDFLVDEGEKFHLWVIEGPQSIKDEFPTDKAGLNVLYVEDLTPYRTRKVRILNGAHTSMVPVAYLYGIDTVREAVEDKVMGRFINEVIYEEIIPTLELSKEELENFAGEVLNRFKNPFIKHYLTSIALNSMSKYETRVLPSLLEYFKIKGTLPKKLVFSLAALIAFYKGDRNGEKIPLNDDRDIMSFYESLWIESNSSVESLRYIVTRALANESIWKMDLNKIPGLTDLLTKYLIDIEKNGMSRAISGVI